MDPKNLPTIMNSDVTSQKFVNTIEEMCIDEIGNNFDISDYQQRIVQVLNDPNYLSAMLVARFCSDNAYDPNKHMHVTPYEHRIALKACADKLEELIEFAYTDLTKKFRDAINELNVEPK